MPVSLAYVTSQANSRYAEPHRKRPDSASRRSDGTCDVRRSVRESARGECREAMHQYASATT